MKMAQPSILVVDDDQQLAEEFTFAFQCHGWIATPVFDGRAALAQYAHRPYDVVLLDLKMDGMDGFQVIVELRKLDPLACIIFLTGYANVARAVEGLRLGAVHMLGKEGLSAKLLIEMVTRTHAMYRDSLRKKRADEYEMLCRFVQSLSHQFRNNVAGIATYLQAIEMKLRQPVIKPDELIRLVQGAFATNKLVLSTLDRLENFAKSRTFRPQAVSLTAAVERAVENAVLMHAAHFQRDDDYKLTVDVPADATVAGHAVFLPVVFEAVLDNAIYALRECGDDGPPGHIGVTAAVADGRARVVIEDTGRGFSDFILRNGPEMYRSGKTDPQLGAGAGAGVGSGVGLATADHIVRQCGGSLAVGNACDPRTGAVRGARVVIELQTVPDLDSPSPEVPS